MSRSTDPAQLVGVAITTLRGMAWRHGQLAVLENDPAELVKQIQFFTAELENGQHDLSLLRHDARVVLTYAAGLIALCDHLEKNDTAKEAEKT